MDFFWEMLSLQETLFLLILLGVLVKKLKIIRENGRKTLSDLLIYAILPCNIVASFMGGITLPDGFVHNCILAVCISIGIQVLSIYGSKLLFRRYPANQKSVLSYGMICSNSSFVGLPIAHLMFGDLGVIYTSVFQIPLRFTMWTAGLSLFTDVSKKDAFRKLVRHPCIIAVFVGLILMVAPISLPNFLEEAIDITSGCTVRQDSRLSAEEVRRLSSAYFLCRRRNEVNEMEATVQRKTLTMEDRKVLAEMWAAGERAAVIAVKLGVCPDTVYKELKRGYTGTLNELSRPAYDPARGQAEYQRRLRNRGRWRRDKEEHHGAEAET